MLSEGLHKDLSRKEFVVEKGGHRNKHISAIYLHLGLQLPLQPECRQKWQVPHAQFPVLGEAICHAP